jgi:TetR/AcrR family transcriptional regulator, transcriptional repressor for nem operon
MAMPQTDQVTSSRILDIAERLVQTRGFNGFSYADISTEVGISKASLHYHFPTKAALGQRLVERYERVFLAALDEIDTTQGSTDKKLAAYAEIYVRVLKGGRMCLCGMLAADYATLPAALQASVRRFFAANEAWVTKVLSQGRSKKEVAFAGNPADAAHTLVSTLEGAMLLARTDNNVGRFRKLAAAQVRTLVTHRSS